MAILRNKDTIVSDIEYGALYNWYAATDSRKITSSDDWVVPITAYWDDLCLYLGGSTIAGGKLKESGLTHWNTPNTGATNSSGFNGIGSGYRILPETVGDPSFSEHKYSMHIWTDAAVNSTQSNVLFLSYISNSAQRYNSDFYNGYAIRLCNPTTLLSEGVMGTYTQNNGTIIPTIVINGVEWTMNLNETEYRNGDWITGFDNGVYTPISNEDWAALTSEGMCYYNDIIDTGGTLSTVKGKILRKKDVASGGYVALYNWFLTQGIDGNSISSSSEWTVPSKIQLENLLNSIDTYELGIEGWPLAGGYLKEIGFTHWYYPNSDAIDSYGFSIRGAGLRSIVDGIGTWEEVNSAGNLWSSTETDGINSYAIWAMFNDAIMHSQTDAPKQAGEPIRLCNPSTLLLEGATGTYTGNDGKVYPTIVINGVEWLSQNLNETQLRDNSWIHGYDLGVYTPISNEDWALLETPAMCFYNDLESNGVAVITKGKILRRYIFSG